MTRDGSCDLPASFTLASYARDRAASLIITLLCAGGTFGMCMVLGLSTDASIAISVFILLCAAFAFSIEYARRARFWRDVQAITESAHGACEAAELLPLGSFLEGSITLDLAEHISMQASAELTAAQADAEAYREYVELWIHEAKTPIAAARLILDRMSGADADALGREVERVDNQVEQALYYARSTALQKDYAIRHVNLAKAAREACKRQARFLVEKQAIPVIDIPDDQEVLSDAPWLIFMFGQVVANAAQYGARTIRFSTHEEALDTPHGHTILTVEDDGCGISEADMPRVFERGFTGTNGRASGTATGMGLYLIALMCQRLGLGISLASEEGAGTRVIFSFPHDRRLT